MHDGSLALTGPMVEQSESNSRPYREPYAKLILEMGGLDMSFAKNAQDYPTTIYIVN